MRLARTATLTFASPVHQETSSSYSEVSVYLSVHWERRVTWRLRSVEAVEPAVLSVT